MDKDIANDIVFATFGLMIGLIFGVALERELGIIVRTAQTLKTQCEVSLPRNRQCVMKFVPKTKGTTP